MISLTFAWSVHYNFISSWSFHIISAMLRLLKECDRQARDWPQKPALHWAVPCASSGPYVVPVDTTGWVLIFIRHADPIRLCRRCEALLWFVCPEQKMAAPFYLTEFLPSAKLCQLLVELHFTRKTTRFAEWFGVCHQDDTSLHRACHSVFRELYKLGEVKWEK